MPDSDKDKTLLRPLFRQTAIHTKQIETGAIPQLWLGGIGAGIGAGLRAVGPWAARTWRAGKTAAGPAWQATKKGAVATYKHPYTQRGILGLEAGAVGAGAEESRRALMGKESLYSDRPASLGSGIASMYGGLCFGARTLAAGRAIPGMAKTGAKWAGRTPAPILLPIGAGVAGMVETGFKETVRDEKAKRIPEEQLVQLEDTLKGLGESPNVQDVIGAVDNFKLTDTQKTAVYETLGIPLELMPKAEQKIAEKEIPSATEKGENSQSTAPLSTIEVKMIAVTPAVLDTTGMAKEELDDIATTQNQAVNKANSEVANALSSTDPEFIREFATAKNSIKQVMGNDNSANLILMKLASGLLTGKSASKGVAGLGDILGQAMGPTVDTAMVLAQSQKEFDQNLAKDIMASRAEYQKELLKGSQVKASQERVFIQETTDDPLFPVVGRYVPVNKSTGTYLEAVMTPQGEQLVPYVGNGRTAEVSNKNRDVAFKSMKDLKVGLEFARIVQMAPEGSMGAGGQLRQFYDTVIGAGRGASSSFTPNMQEWNNNTFNEITDQIQNWNPGGTIEDAKLLKKYGDEASGIMTKFMKENDKLQEDLSGAFESGDQERVARAQLGLIEQRMMYIIANANKETDRITVRDIENAEKRTKVFGLFMNEKQIRKNYGAIEKELTSKFKANVSAYVTNGGNPNYVLEQYKSVGPIMDYLKYRDTQQTKQGLTGEDYDSILEGI